MTRFLRWIGLAKYNNEPLCNALERTFGGAKLGDSRTRLVIPALNLETGEVYIFKTAHHPRLRKDYKTNVVDVGMATAAAPTYFPTHRLSSGVPLVDGGTWANNPVGLSVVEAIGMLGWERDKLRILSIGGPSVPSNIGYGRLYGLGIGYWVTKITEVFMSGQASGSIGTAEVLAGHGNLHRISPIVPLGRFSLDGVKEIDSLQGLGESEGRKAFPRLKETFFQTPTERFSPYYSESTD